MSIINVFYDNEINVNHAQLIFDTAVQISIGRG